MKINVTKVKYFNFFPNPFNPSNKLDPFGFIFGSLTKNKGIIERIETTAAIKIIGLKPKFNFQNKKSTIIEPKIAPEVSNIC